MLLVKELPRFPITISEVTVSLEEGERRFAYVLASAQRRAREANVDLQAHVLVGRLVQKVVEFVDENQVDLLVVGLMRHSPFHDFIVGNTAERLARQVRCAVHVVK